MSEAVYFFSHLSTLSHYIRTASHFYFPLSAEFVFVYNVHTYTYMYFNKVNITIMGNNNNTSSRHERNLHFVQFINRSQRHANEKVKWSKIVNVLEHNIDWDFHSSRVVAVWFDAVTAVVLCVYFFSFFIPSYLLQSNKSEIFVSRKSKRLKPKQQFLSGLYCIASRSEFRMDYISDGLVSLYVCRIYGFGWINPSMLCISQFQIDSLMCECFHKTVPFSLAF